MPKISLHWGPVHGEIGVLKKQIFFCKYLCTSCLLQKWVSFKRVQLVPFSLPSWSRSVHFVLFRYKMQGISIWNIWIQHPVDNLIWSEAKKSKILKLWASTTIKLNNERIVYLWRVENEEERWEVEKSPVPRSLQEWDLRAWAAPASRWRSRWWFAPQSPSTSQIMKNFKDLYCFFLQVPLFYLDKFLSDPGIPGVRSMGPSLSNSLSTTPFWNKLCKLCKLCK